MAQHHLILHYLNDLSQEITYNINNVMILNNLRLKDSIYPESEIERKSIELAIGTDDKITATSFKLFVFITLLFAPGCQKNELNITSDFDCFG